jgi:vitamin B12/bleomycin/antimicrobial peptide transport system ATP-binding/permease protein
MSKETIASKSTDTLDSGIIRDFITLAKPFWVSEEKWIARGTLALVLTLSLSLIAVSVLLNEWNRSFFNAIENHDYADFEFQLLHFVVLAVIYVAIAVNLNFFSQGLEMRWRRWLTRQFVGRWMGHKTYYNLQLQSAEADNPDQRIAEDLRLFASLTLTLSLGFLSSAVTVISFTAILWHLSGVIEVPVGRYVLPVHGYMVLAAIVYSVLGTWATHKIGQPLPRLNFAQQALEADFRFSMVRVRENADGIAFYHGEENAKASLNLRFQRVFDNWWRIMHRQKRIAWFTLSFGQSATVLPLLLAAPRFLSGALTLGGLTQSVAAFTQIQSALSWFVNIFTPYAEWRATLDRLRDFARALERYSNETSPQAIELIETSGDELRIDNLALQFPSGMPMLRCDSLRLSQGERVMLMGPSGSGKSTLLRAIAKLWPYGSGRIEKPGTPILFMPQRAYLPIATIREIITYPARAGDIPDAMVCEALEACGLGHLAEKLEEKQNWSLSLSGGEQQRVGFARAILLRPSWLFLDESTSALDTDTEAHLYALIAKRLPGSTIFSVSHRTGLAAYHSRVIRTRYSDQDKVWVIEDSEVAAEPQRRMRRV